MKMNRAEDGSATIELLPEEVEQFRVAMERLTATFVRLSPVIKRLADGIKALQPDLDKARQACQRLDPAFSGPPLDSIGFTCKCPDGACVCAPEHGGVWPVPGPEPKADWHA